VSRNGDTADGVNAVLTQMTESEDNVDAVEDLKASESVAAAPGLNEDDSLYGSSEESEDESSNDEAAANITAAAKKAATASLRKAKSVMCRTYLSSTWAGGLPRTKAVVNEAEVPAVGAVLPNRDSCELLARELYEKWGSLVTVSTKGCCNTVDTLTVGTGKSSMQAPSSRCRPTRKSNCTRT